MNDEEIGKIRLFEFEKGAEFASNVLNKEIAERDATIKQLQEENHRLKGLLREWIDQFGYPGKSLTNDTLNAIKQNP